MLDDDALKILAFELFRRFGGMRPEYRSIDDVPNSISVEYIEMARKFVDAIHASGFTLAADNSRLFVEGEKVSIPELRAEEWDRGYVAGITACSRWHLQQGKAGSLEDYDRHLSYSKALADLKNVKP